MPQLASLVSIATAVPPYCIEQDDVAVAARRIFADNFGEYERLARVFKSSGIRQRHAVRPLDWYFEPLGWPERTEAYLDGGCQLFFEVATKALGHRLFVASPSCSAFCLPRVLPWAA